MPTFAVEALLLSNALFYGWFAPKQRDGDTLAIYLGFLSGIVLPSLLALLSHVWLGVTVASLVLVPFGYAVGAGWDLVFGHIQKVPDNAIPKEVNPDRSTSDAATSTRTEAQAQISAPVKPEGPRSTSRPVQLRPLARVLFIPLLLLVLAAIPALSLPGEKDPPVALLPCVAPVAVVSLAPLPTPSPTKEPDTLATKIEVAVRQNNLPALVGLLGDLAKLGAAYGEDGVDLAKDATAKGEDLATSVAREFMLKFGGKSGENVSDATKELIEWKIREIRAADSAARLGRRFTPAQSAFAYFELDHSDLVTSANAVAAAVANEYRNTRRVIILVGSADRSGDPSRNYALAEERAISFQAALEARGIKHERIHLRARTELGLPVPTSDDVTEPANRRVDIFVR